MERKEEVSMLKIHSFLRLTKDSLINFIKSTLQRYSKNMAATAYALSAIILVFHVGDLAGLNVDSSQLTVAASSYECGDVKSEETNASDFIASDNKEYALISPDNHILLTNTETVDKLPAGILHDVTIDKNPLGQLSISPVAAKTNDNTVTMAILTMQQQGFLSASSNEDLELLSLRNDVFEVTSDFLPIKSEDTTEALAVADIKVPANLTLAMNKNMKKSLSKKELEVLQRIVEAEATGEDIYGKILVANVVINRMNSSNFPDTVSGVVFQKTGTTYQFSPTRDGRYWSVKISKSTKEAVKRALKGEDYSKGALYFFARKLTTARKANWFDNKLNKVIKYGCHEFYTEK